jgi:hypothetical protein
MKPNKMKIAGGEWIKLPDYPMGGRPLKPRCSKCNRECEARLHRMWLCANCPTTKEQRENAKPKKSNSAALAMLYAAAAIGMPYIKVDKV